MTWHAYSLETGLFTGRCIDGDADALKANLPPGCAWIDGVIDARSQRVDLATEQLVDYVPPAPEPAAEYAWNTEVRRWLLLPEVLERNRRRAAALDRIEQLEAGSIRALREIRVAEVRGGRAPNEAWAKLEAVEAEIAALRADL